jgi:hypothetical protein
MAPSLRNRATDPSVLDGIRADPANFMHLVAMEPDPWQEEGYALRPGRS